MTLYGGSVGCCFFGFSDGLICVAAAAGDSPPGSDLGMAFLLPNSEENGHCQKSTKHPLPNHRRVRIRSMRTPARTTLGFARILGILLSLATLAHPARACLRAELDPRAVQWSTLIVRAKLADRGKAVALSSNSAPETPSTFPTTTAVTPIAVVAPEGFVVNTFEVIEALDGTTSPGQQIHVLRLVSSK